jgi:large subunit ribosomal protein L30e
MARKIIDEEAAIIKKTLEEGKAILGTDETMKLLRQGKLSQVFVTANCPEEVIMQVDHDAPLAGTQIVKVKFTNEQMGDVCKKPFFISLMGVLK